MVKQCKASPEQQTRRLERQSSFYGILIFPGENVPPEALKLPTFRVLSNAYGVRRTCLNENGA